MDMQMSHLDGLLVVAPATPVLVQCLDQLELQAQQLLWIPSNPGIVSDFDTLKNAGWTLEILLDPVTEVRRTDKLDNALAAIASARPCALTLIADRFLLAQRKRMLSLRLARYVSL
jgi:hypothetical protein